MKLIIPNIIIKINAPTKERIAAASARFKFRNGLEESTAVN